MTDRIQPYEPANFNGLALIGEAPGADEMEAGFPFVGKAGRLLDTVLAEVGIIRTDCLITNVFMERPEKNKIDQFFRVPNDDDGEFISRYGMYRNRVPRNDNRHDLERLDDELIHWRPKVIVLLGATALWRMTKENGITAARGKWQTDILRNQMIAIMPTWHPSAVSRTRAEKLPQFVADFKEVAEVIRGLS